MKIYKYWNRNIKIYILFNFIICFQLTSIIQSLFFQKTGITLFQIGMIFAAYLTSKCIFQIPTGFIADKYGRKLSTLLGLILFEIFLLVTYIFRNFNGFIIANVIQGLALAFLSGSLDALFVESIILAQKKDKIPKYDSINRIVSFSAVGLSGLLGGGISVISYNLVYIINIIIQLIPIFLIVFIKETPKIKNITVTKIRLLEVLKYLTSKKILVYFILMDIFIAIAMIPLEDYYSVYLSSLNYNRFFIGIAVSVQYIISSILGLYSSNISTKFNNIKIIKLFPFIMIISYIILFLVKNNIILIVFFYSIGLTLFSLQAPIKYKIFHLNLESKYRSTVLSIKSLGIALVGIIVNPIAGYFLLLKGYQKTFIIIFIISIFFLFINNILFKKIIDIEL